MVAEAIVMGSSLKDRAGTRHWFSDDKRYQRTLYNERLVQPGF